MIGVNLRPGATKRSSSRKLPKMPSLGSLGGGLKGVKMDGPAMFAAVSWLIFLPLTGYMFVSARSRVNELNVSVEGAIADSTKYANIIAANKKLIERRDTIARKVNIIQQIDAGRFVWPHVMDEVSRALPPYTWLTDVAAIESDSTSGPRFHVEGRTGNNFALTKYLQDLEASPFIKEVRLLSTELVRENEKLVYSFIVEASYEEPPPDMIQTVPLFAKESE